MDDLLGRPTMHDYIYYLTRAVALIAQADAVMLGRGADVMLPDSLRVRIQAPREARLQNLMRYEALTERQAEAAIARSDQERGAFVEELARRLGRHRRFDLALDAGTFSVEQSVSIIRDAMHHKFGPLAEKRGHAPAA